MSALDPLAVPVDAPALVEASAGTGKTYTITTLVLRLVLERRLSIAQILVVTYTNAATAELRRRIRSRLREALRVLEGAPAQDETLARLWAVRARAGALDADRRALAAAVRDFDQAAIFTIHGFCQRVLQEHAFESGVAFESELVTEQAPLRDEVLEDFWARELAAAPPILVRHLAARGHGLERFAELLNAALTGPETPVLPEGVGAPADLGALEAPWGEAFAAAMRLWRESRDDVLQLLATSSALPRRRYRRDWLAGWAERMTALFAAASPGDTLRFEHFEKFTASGIAALTEARATPPRHPFFDACEALAGADRALAAALDAAVLGLRLALVRSARSEIRRRLEQTRAQSFDDLLLRLVEALRGPGGGDLADTIRGRFPAALVDEFQDTDPTQYEIFRRIWLDGVGGAIFFVGDPKQAIYSFRGADVFTYLAARADVGGREHTLGTNRRSDPGLVRAVSALFGRLRAPFLQAGIALPPVEPAPGAADALGGSESGRPPLRILVARSSGEPMNERWGGREVPRAVAADVSRFLQGGATIAGRPVEPGDVAILCRTNDQARRTQAELRRLGVPAVHEGDSSVFETEEAEEMERVLAAMANPADGAAIRSALATTVLGATAADLARLGADERRWDERVRRFVALAAAWTDRGFVQAFRRLLESEDVHARLLALEDGERRLTNVLHVAELVQTAAVEGHRGPLALVEWLHRMRTDARARVEVASEAAEIRLESDDRAVKLTTVHKAKGLEYAVVYCPFFWSGSLLRRADADNVRFHQDGVRMLDVGSAEIERHRREAELEALAENLRLLYVALTRARHRCTIVWGAFTRAESSPLGALLHLPADARPADVAGVREAVAERLRVEQRMMTDLRAIEASSAGAIAIAELGSGRGPRFVGRRDGAAAMRCLEARRRIGEAHRTSSFSRLVLDASEVSEPEEEGIDRDALDAPAPSAGGPDGAARIVLHDFPAGARSGELVHAIFEAVDFAAGARDEIGRQVALHGFDPRWAAPLARAVDDVLATPLGEGGIRLCDVAREQRIDEMEFLLTVAGGGDEPRLGPDRLAAAFERHGAPRHAPAYASRLRALGFEPLAGFLRGFVDLVFEEDGRWWIADYKSNFLGPSAADYGAPRLVEAMAHHHYFLQYHLYALALHRHLRARLAGYDYERHFGGVFYLFVRGMSPAAPDGNGVFADRPPRELLEELDRLLG